MAIADDITQARSAGFDDQTILDGLAKFHPEYADSIKQAADAGFAPKDIVSGLGAFQAQQNAVVQGNKPLYQKLLDPLQYGLSQTAAGDAATLNVLGQGGPSQVAGSVAKMTAPKDYTPSTGFDWHHPIDTAQAGLQSVAEGVAPLLHDAIGGVIGGAVGGLAGTPAGPVGSAIAGGAGSAIGFGAGAAMRSYATDLQSMVKARTGDPNAQPTQAEQIRALAASGLDGLLEKFGAGGAGAGVVKAGEAIVPQVAGNLLKAGGAMGASSAAGSAANQALLTGSVDPNQTIDAGLTGAGLGAVTHAVTALPKDITAARMYGGITPDQAAPVKTMLDAAQQQLFPGAAYRGTPGQDGQIFTKVDQDLGIHIKALATDNGAQIKAIKVDNPHDNTGEVLDRVRADIGSQRAPAPTDMQTLSDNLGQFPEGQALVDSLGHQVTLNRIKQLGSYDSTKQTLTAGSNNIPFVQTFLNPLGRGSAIEDGAAIIYSALGATAPGYAWMHALGGPLGAFALPAAQAGAYGALRAGDSLTGNSVPVSQFMRRFNGVPDRPLTDPLAPLNPNSVGPSFVEAQKQANAALKAAQASAKAQGPAEAQNAKIDQQAQDATYAQVKRQALLMARSAKLATQQQAAAAKTQAAAVNSQLQNAKATSALMKRSEANPSSTPASQIIALARLKQQYARQAEVGPATTPAATQLNGATPTPRSPTGQPLDPGVYVPPGAQQQAPPQVPPQSAGPTIPIQGVNHVRDQSLSDILVSPQAIAEGMSKRQKARASILNSIPMTPADRAKWSPLMAPILRDVNNASTATHARAIVARYSENLSLAGRSAVAQALEENEARGHTFYGTWRHQ